MLKLFTLGACCLAGAAAAQETCLTDRDLSRGVEMRYAEGDVFVASRGRNGNLVLVENYSDGSPSTQFTGAYSLYIETEVELENGKPVDTTLLTIDFGKPSTTLPAPTPGGGFTTTTTNIFADGSQRSENYIASFGDLTTMELSGCTYDMIPAMLRYEWPGENDGMTVNYAYLPAIGASFLTSSQFDGEELLSLSPVSLQRRQK